MVGPIAERAIAMVVCVLRGGGVGGWEATGAAAEARGAAVGLPMAVELDIRRGHAVAPLGGLVAARDSGKANGE